MWGRFSAAIHRVRPLPSSMEVRLKADYANADSISLDTKQIHDFSSVKEVTIGNRS